MLSVRGISKSFKPFAITDVSFEVDQGQYFVLLGASGVGKSVLLETIAGLVRPDAGRIFLDGKDITDEKIQNRRLGLVFQDSTLFPHKTVYDNLAYPLRCRKLRSNQIREQVSTLAEKVGAGGLLEAYPGTLSGGEAQRISLARVLASEPRCLLLDEPLSSLDVKARSEMRALLRKINAAGQTILHVTHDYTEAVSLATHVAVMEGGEIAQAGTVEEIFHHPRSEFIARFVGIRNFFRGLLAKSCEEPTKSREFKTDGLCFSVLTDSGGGNGFVCIRSEDVTISNTASQTSARNNFEGTIVDIVRAGVGVEVIVDIGGGVPVEIAALVTSDSVKLLDLHRGKKVWISFKASAIRYVEG
jgi:molybdopterin-binding protein